ncbi:MAG: ribosome-binding factor A [Rickettsiales bacterium]|nr:ribosome-binding factor A [Rickettsiales bacterium]
MQTKNNRLLRVGENIRAILSENLLSNDINIQELSDDVIITITEVQPSKDLRYAKAYVSSLGEDEKKVSEILNNYSNVFSKLVAKQIETKYSPKISFFPDLSFQTASKINTLINQK